MDEKKAKENFKLLEAKMQKCNYCGVGPGPGKRMLGNRMKDGSKCPPFIYRNKDFDIDKLIAVCKKCSYKIGPSSIKERASEKPAQNIESGPEIGSPEWMRAKALELKTRLLAIEDPAKREFELRKYGQLLAVLDEDT